MKKGFVLLIAAMAIAWSMVNSNKQTMVEMPRVGYQSPSFSLSGLDHEIYELGGDQDKPIVLNFWASWCGPCRVEAPELVHLFEQYQDRIEVYAVNLTSMDTFEGASEFADHYHFPFPDLLDKQGTFMNQYQFQAVPTTFLSTKC